LSFLIAPFGCFTKAWPISITFDFFTALFSLFLY
jgi:hypothetical protein